MANNTRRLDLMVTEEEYQELIRQKEFLKLPSYSSLIRMYINNAVCFSINFDGLFEISTQIARIGNNINQVARVANESQSVSECQIEILQKEMKELEDKVAQISNSKTELTKYIARETRGANKNGNNENNKG